MINIKKIIKNGINLMGFDLVRTNQIPHNTFMGLKSLPIKTIVDVGANVGQFAKMVASIYPEANIHSFEPLPEVYHELLNWANKLNGRVSTYNVALGDKEDILTMHCHIDHNSSSSLLKTTKCGESLFPQIEKQTAISINQTTLDKWMSDFSDIIKPEILIKLDVQGYEDRVIRGGINLFKRAKACILEINLAEIYHEQASFRDIFMLLDKAGYHYSGNFSQEYDKEGQVIYIDALFLQK